MFDEDFADEFFGEGEFFATVYEEEQGDIKSNHKYKCTYCGEHKATKPKCIFCVEVDNGYRL